MRNRTLVLLLTSVVSGLAVMVPTVLALAASQAGSRGAIIRVDAPFEGPVQSATFNPSTGEFTVEGYEDFKGGTWEGRAYWKAVARRTLNGKIEFDAIQTFQPDTIVHGCGVGGFQLKEQGYGDPFGITPAGIPVHAEWQLIKGSGTGDLSALRWGEGTFDYVMQPTLTYPDGETHGIMKCSPPQPGP